MKSILSGNLVAPFFGLTNILSFGLMGIGSIGMIIAITTLWRASANPNGAKRAISAEWSLFWLGILNGAGLSIIAYPIISHLTHSFKGALSLVGLAGISAVFAGFEKFHIKSDFQRRSPFGVIREVIIFSIVTLLATILFVAAWQVITGMPKSN